MLTILKVLSIYWIGTTLADNQKDFPDGKRTLSKRLLPKKHSVSGRTLLLYIDNDGNKGAKIQWSSLASVEMKNDAFLQWAARPRSAPINCTART